MIKDSSGAILVKDTTICGKSGDITGGLPRVTEFLKQEILQTLQLLSEIDGIVSFGKIKRGNQRDYS